MNRKLFGDNKKLFKKSYRIDDNQYWLHSEYDYLYLYDYLLEELRDDSDLDLGDDRFSLKHIFDKIASRWL